MKRIFCISLFILFTASSALAQAPIVDRSISSDPKYLSFSSKVDCGQSWETRCLWGLSWIWQKQEVGRWKRAVGRATDMLPVEFLENINQISWNFFVDRSDWATAYASSSVQINLLSKYKNPPEWMIWEPYRKNGLNELERMFVALHEVAHIYGSGSELNALYKEEIYYIGWSRWDWDKSIKQFILSSGVEENRITNYREGEVTLYGKARGQHEDFAEAFALYVMWPGYLKEYFPLHYDIIKGILAVEYESVYPMPSSIKSRLTVKKDGKDGS